MALNAASHNAGGVPTGSTSGQPAVVSDETKSDILTSAADDAAGQNIPGKDLGDLQAGTKVKSEKELAKERAKAEKHKKFLEKQAKVASQNTASKAKEAKKKAEKKEEVLPKFKNETPVGEKKVLKPLDDPLYNSYHPEVVESSWQAWWQREKYFEPKFDADGNVSKEGHFVIIIPPPNITGKLHIGHALATSLQDLLIRWHRMKGFTTLYLPGCDHAGISTQSVIENLLWRREKKTRHDIGRPALIERIWKWKDEYHGHIRNTLDRLGGSFDWSREAFTMDENLTKAVTETFVKLHEEGLIYRSNRLVNWCTTLRTALSNLEVENKEIEGRTLIDVPGYDKKIEFGVLTFFKYPIEGTSETITVATTRPETLLGDTGVAVHPKDERYKHLVGKTIKHPFVDRTFPIIADEYVDMEYGTGAVKLTPAHDPNDFTLGQKHKLEFINILNDDGTLNENAGPQFEGKKRFDVRYLIKSELEKLGLFEKTENNPMKVPLCIKSKDVIEPIMKPQWWMKMKDLADDAMKVVEDGSIKIIPDSARRNYFNWMRNINDWCLSRQIWWGHQIPAYNITLEGGEKLDEIWIVARSEEEAKEKAQKQFPGKKFTLQRDEDTLDTWFSSGLFPFSTLGWPNDKALDLQKLFPTSVLETGWDILFFWVARMIFLSLKLTGKVPFKEVYCHSLVRDSEGRKMSKSLGNVVDPIDIMEGITLKELNDKLVSGNLDPAELKRATKYQQTAFPQGIPECGSDALRFSLIQYTTGGGDIAFDIKVIHAYRRFANKIYQATKYVLGKIDPQYVPPKDIKKTGRETLAEKWILAKLNDAAKGVNESLTQREFSRSTQILYRYIYDELCDVFIENSKGILQDGTLEEKKSTTDTLYTAIEGALILLHPFMPFLSEELWQRIPRREGDKTPSITIAKYLQFDPTFVNIEAEKTYELVLSCSKGIRNLIADNKVTDAQIVIHAPDNDTIYGILNREIISIRSLAGKGLGSINLLSQNDASPSKAYSYGAAANIIVYLEIKGDVNIDEEISKAQTKLKKASDVVAKQQKLIATEDFQTKVSKAIQDAEQEKLDESQAQVRNYERSIEMFEALKLK